MCESMKTRRDHQRRAEAGPPAGIVVGGGARREGTLSGLCDEQSGVQSLVRRRPHHNA